MALQYVFHWGTRGPFLSATLGVWVALKDGLSIYFKHHEFDIRFHLQVLWHPYVQSIDRTNITCLRSLAKAGNIWFETGTSLSLIQIKSWKLLIYLNIMTIISPSYGIKMPIIILQLRDGNSLQPITKATYSFQKGWSEIFSCSFKYARYWWFNKVLKWCHNSCEIQKLWCAVLFTRTILL